jgi:hypothetical protein
LLLFTVGARLKARQGNPLQDAQPPASILNLHWQAQVRYSVKPYLSARTPQMTWIFSGFIALEFIALLLASLANFGEPFIFVLLCFGGVFSV